MGGGYSQNGCNGVVNGNTNYEMVDLDGTWQTFGTRTKSDVQYLKIRNGQDEYKWWIEEAIQDSTDDDCVRMKRGGYITGRKQFVLPESYALTFGSKP